MGAHALFPVLEILRVINVTNDGASALINVADLRCSETIQFLCTQCVEVNGICERDEKACQWHAHGLVVGAVVCGETSNGREKGATTN